MTSQTRTLPIAPNPSTVSIDDLILTVRGERAILAGDLAAIYGVATRALNQAVKRNVERFPGDFAFRVTPQEFAALQSQRLVQSDGRAALRSQIVILKRGQHAKYPPLAFTKHGAIMAANVLNSREAVAMSVYVVRAFVKQRETVAANQAVLKRLAELDTSLLQHERKRVFRWTCPRLAHFMLLGNGIFDLYREQVKSAIIINNHRGAWHFCLHNDRTLVRSFMSWQPPGCWHSTWVFRHRPS